MDKLLWNAKYWALRKAAAEMGWVQGDGALTLAQAWHGLQPHFA